MISAQAEHTSEWHRREAARLLQRAEITRMSDAEQVFWFGDTHRARADRHLAWARNAEAAREPVGVSG
jgi:hypothetical protein